MRTLVLGLALIAASAVAQNPVSQLHPKKILTPEQIAFQQEMRVYDAELDRLRLTATTAYAAEAAREETPECPDADDTLAINQCIVREDDLTTANYKVFTAALRDILALPRPNAPRRGHSRGRPDRP